MTKYSGLVYSADMSATSSSFGASAGSTGGRAVAKAAGILIAFVLLSRVMGLVRDSVIAYQFGETGNTDNYTAAFRIPDLLMYLVAGGALSSTFIPVFSEYIHKGDDEGAWQTFSIVASVTALVGGALVLVAWIFAPWFVQLLNPGYSVSEIRFTTQLTRIVLPAQIFFMLGGLMMGTLNVRGNFLIPALGPTIYNLGIIFGAIALHSLGMPGLMWGALGGAVIGNFVLQLAYVRQGGLRFRPSLAFSHPGAVKVWRLLLPILLGVSLPNVDQIINSYFASELPHGSQTAVQYATRLMLIPIGVFAQAIGQAVLPTLSAHAAAGEQMEMRRTIVKALRNVLFLTLPASALMYVLSEPIVAMLFQHGKFHYEDTIRTAGPLRFYSLGVFAWSAQAILTRSFYAVQDSRTPVISGTVMTAVFIVMNWIVVHETSLGASGLALATTIAATLHMLVMLYFIHRRLGRIAASPLLVSTFKTLLATLALCIFCWPAANLLEHFFSLSRHPILSVPIFVISSLVGMAAFVGAAFAMRMDELHSAVAMIRRRRGTT